MKNSSKYYISKIYMLCASLLKKQCLLLLRTDFVLNFWEGGGGVGGWEAHQANLLWLKLHAFELVLTLSESPWVQLSEGVPLSVIECNIWMLHIPRAEFFYAWLHTTAYLPSC